MEDTVKEGSTILQILTSQVGPLSSEQVEQAKGSKQEREAAPSAQYKDCSSGSGKKGLHGGGREACVNRFVC